MPAPPELEWYQPAAELMARQGLTLAEAATRLKVPLNTEEARNTFRTKTFQRLLRAERLRYYGEVGRDPDWSKKTAIGQLLHCIQELMTEGEFDKAAEVILKAAKIEGWLGNEGTQVTVFGSLSQRELDEARQKLRKLHEDTPLQSN